jgi:hypothetical protein
VRRKKKAGRPPLPGGREKFTTTLPPGYSERLRAIGNGNASAAIVQLVDDHERRGVNRLADVLTG